MYFLIIQINNFRGDLSDISAIAATPVYSLVPLSTVYYRVLFDVLVLRPVCLLRISCRLLLYHASLFASNLPIGLLWGCFTHKCLISCMKIHKHVCVGVNHCSGSADTLVRSPRFVYDLLLYKKYS